MLVGINDLEIAKHIMTHLPVSRKKEQEWIEKVKNPTSNDIVLMVETITGERCGVMGLHNINHMHGTCTTGAVFPNKELHGKGYGVDAKFALLHYAFMTLNMRKVCSSVKASNPRSKAYQERNGYKHVGTRYKQLCVDGEYVDEYLMEVFKEDFLPLYEAHIAS
jgi:RimJ/RimL family protein N-acetyltransferase